MFMNFINELTTILVASAPISELRGSIPLALEVFKFSIPKALLLSLIGNFLPVPIILSIFEPVEKMSRKYLSFTNRFFDWIYKRTRHKFEGDYLKWGELALIIFVAIPLPVTGAWTGSLAAYIFGIPKKKSILFIFIGILIASIIVTLLDLFVSNSIKHIFLKSV